MLKIRSTVFLSKMTKPFLRNCMVWSGHCYLLIASLVASRLQEIYSSYCFLYISPEAYIRLNMELDIRSLFGLHVYSCTHWLRPRPPPPPDMSSYTRALLVSQDRRHLFVAPPEGSTKVLWAGRGGMVPSAARAN